MGLRLITFVTPTGGHACFFTDKAEPLPTLHNAFPMLRGCKFEVDLQIELQQHEVERDTLYFAVTETENSAIISELNAIAESLEKQRLIENDMEAILEKQRESLLSQEQPAEVLIPLNEEIS